MEIITQKRKNTDLGETRIAQIGGAVMIAGFAIQIIGNVFFEQTTTEPIEKAYKLKELGKIVRGQLNASVMKKHQLY